jgi:hypothetical protein
MDIAVGKRSWQRGQLIVAALAMICVFTTGCDSEGYPFAMSAQPVYTPGDLEADSRLNGTWVDSEGDVAFSFREGAEEGKEKVYTLVVTEKEEGHEESGEFEAHLIRLGAVDFLDFYPRRIKEGSEFYRAHFLRAHAIARVEIRQDTIQLQFLSSSWLKAKTEDKSVDASWVKTEDAVLLTGATEEVQELLILYANDEEAFPDPLLLARRETEEPGE